MMLTKTFFSTTACCLLLTTTAIAQNEAEATQSESTQAETAQAESTQDQSAQDEMTQEETAAADEAADAMFVEVYGTTVPTYLTAAEAIDRIESIGYTNIHDFDVEWGHYSVEATAPDGNEVEIEFDPVTGAILDVDDNWF